MLDTETKRRIDSARDILVGKVPDPKSQVEQITIALIYKFMDDMDAEAEELGGQRTFFSGEFARFGWAQLMDVSLGGNETLMRYSEALEKMKENPNIPDLFRNIFRNVFLPYRDPETLKSFLKVINDFTYDHSERLGDAFEYLLSVMDSQGAAGQFRTPRHIIDFMVELVDPQKNDRVLDPACGTAGFLISAFKHILKTSRETDQILTPDEKTRLMQNFTGYDISPDMVRLSRVNLYLHGFQTPNIHEYDTLTSDERWNESADVIMANPPFMSPSGGGIRPHKRFSVESNRSEVLFVDYIMEHLTVAGRAAIIVPEGIIFQSGKAYKALRKMLVENDYLVGVISLPAGVFNPYSGVKTSILWLDRALAKKTDSIVFAKIESDGFDLGAQRKQNGKNDLPKYLHLLKNIQSTIIDSTQNSYDLTSNISIISKQEIRNNGDYNFTAERYSYDNKSISEFSYKTIGEVCNVITGSTPLKSNSDYWENGTIPWFTIDDLREQGRIINYTKQFITDKALKKTSIKIVPKNSLLLCCTASVGEYAFANMDLTTNQQFNSLIIKPEFLEKILPKFLFILSVGLGKKLQKLGGTTSFKFISVKDLTTIRIPIPPIDIQQELVVEIESYQKIIDGARLIDENYRPRIEIDPSWPIFKLGDICKNHDSERRPVTKSDRTNGIYPYYGASGIVDYVDDFIFDGDYLLVSEDGANLRARVTPIAFSVEGKTWVNNHSHILRFENRIIQSYVEIFLNSIDLSMYITGSAQPKLSQGNLNIISIPLPPDPLIEKLVKEILTEQKHVFSATKLVDIYEQKIRDRVSKIWGE